MLRHFNDAELVELTAVCGLFAQSNRFQDSMRLPIEEQHEVDRIRTSVRADPEKLKAYVERMLAHWPREFPAPAPVTPAGGSPVEKGDAFPARVPLLDGASGGDSARFLAAAAELLGGTPNAIRTWAHTPHVAKFFLALHFVFERDGLGSLLPAPLRLMLLLRTHHVHAARYMAAHHTALGRAAGLASAQLAALARPDAAESPQLAERDRAAVAWAGKVATNSAKHDVRTFAELSRHFPAPAIVEMTALCAVASNADLVYNALRVPLEPPDAIAALYPAVAANPQKLRRYLERIVADWPSVFPALDRGRD